MQNHITDVPEVAVGHQQNQQAKTGCTVVLTKQGATAGVDVRGSAPGTREIDLLDPTNTVEQVHGILLTGGSAFGLAAADGVMQALEEKNVGFDVGVTQVPIVPSAVLFDLNLGRSDFRPTAKMGYQAVQQASPEATQQGKIGVGMGCTVGKLKGISQASPSGIGSASCKLNNDIYLGALTAVNAFGDILDEENNIIAGCQTESGNFINTAQAMQNETAAGLGKNTTLGVIATNAHLTKPQATKLAQVAHNGYAQHINPVHTALDGDTIFALSTGEQEIDFNLLLASASKVMGQAIVNAVQTV